MKNFIKTNSILLLFFVSTFAVLIIAGYSAMLMVNSTNMLEYNIEQRMLALSRHATLLVTSDELAELVNAEDMEKPLYGEIKERLRKFSEESNILYTYYLRPTENGQMAFIVDNDFDPDTVVDLSSEPIITEPSAEQALKGIASFSGLGNYLTDWEGLATAYAPVYDNEGNIVAIAGVDMSDEQIISTKTSVEILIVVMITCLIVAMMSGFVGFNLYKKKAELSESANIAKSEFLSRMSHEIRTPMNAIIGFCRMAKDSNDISEIKNHLDNISTSSTHLLKVVNDILDLSKIDSGKIILNEIPISLVPEIENICKIVNPQISNKNLKFSINLNDNLPDYVFCDNLHLKQILINLLSNAIKFTPENGKVSLDVRLIESKNNLNNISWSVKDTGIGIKDEVREKLFEPFEQGDGSTTRKYGGTGLGLSIARQLVELMGGTITIDSIYGQGSTFTFNTVLRSASYSDFEKNIIENESSFTKIDLSGKHFLLVEDSEINQLIAENIFSGWGATVDIANNGLEGVNKYLENPFKYDIIFMDIQMPVMDGYEATVKIRNSGMSNALVIPIIAMTANVFAEDIQKSSKSGMNAHVGKPLEIEQIEAAIANVI